MQIRFQKSVDLLRDLIKIQSYSGEEASTADVIQVFLNEEGISTERIHNNIIAKSKSFDSFKKTIVLNSHHDTVKIGEGWSKDPLGAEIEDGKLYGRGSNDAGGCLVSLIAAFCHFYNDELPYNLILIASGEEENFGTRGVSSVLKELEIRPALGIIGEPTEMHLAIAEKGLIVIDGLAEGIAGHAARDIGENALYLAMNDIQWVKNYNWDLISDVLGRTKTTVTQIAAGSQHNVIPDQCSFVIDCRVNEHYSLNEVLEILQSGTQSKLTPRSLKWHPSGIDINHSIVNAGKALGRNVFGSPTLSDQVHFTCPTVKVGPGKSERSHTIDEYVGLSEIEEAIVIYIKLLQEVEL
ncbi:MAG: acetylornithine deacetylase [Saprospiraceae bacterium]|jgi:acetylornithine deacetylase